MEEFSAGSALSALGDRPSDGVSKEQLILSGLTHVTPGNTYQLSRQTSLTPGLRYRNLGKSGLRVSNVGLGKLYLKTIKFIISFLILGTWPIFGPGMTEEQAEQIVALAMDSGINVFDLSEAHSGIYKENYKVKMDFLKLILQELGRKLSLDEY